MLVLFLIRYFMDLVFLILVMMCKGVFLLLFLLFIGIFFFSNFFINEYLFFFWYFEIKCRKFFLVRRFFFKIFSILFINCIKVRFGSMFFEKRWRKFVCLLMFLWLILVLFWIRKCMIFVVIFELFFCLLRVCNRIVCLK